MLRLIRNFLARRAALSLPRPPPVTRLNSSTVQGSKHVADAAKSPTDRDAAHPLGSPSALPSRGNNGPPQLLINCLRNNIFFCLSKAPGETLFALSAGRAGFPGAQKTSPKAALAMLDVLARKLEEMGVDRLRLNFRGLNPARPILIGQLRRMGLRITEVVDTTGVPHNGCRPPKARRL